MTGLSYEEINVWLFIIIQPGLVFFFIFDLELKKQYQQSSNDIRHIQATLERGESNVRYANSINEVLPR